AVSEEQFEVNFLTPARVAPDKPGYSNVCVQSSSLVRVDMACVSDSGGTHDLQPTPRNTVAAHLAVLSVSAKPLICGKPPPE
ncbi:hypothetical protein, partial [Mesorhizobium sp.]|uniref:hypothetical protein n=1 Tax=Mesorhizobium sp. TaxID=1871066 RepID=UPI00257D0E7E